MSSSKSSILLKLSRFRPRGPEKVRIIVELKGYCNSLITFGLAGATTGIAFPTLKSSIRENFMRKEEISRLTQ